MCVCVCVCVSRQVRSLREARDGAAAASSDLTDDTATVPASLHDELVAGYVARIASLERDLRLARQLPGVRRRHPAQHASRYALASTFQRFSSLFSLHKQVTE